MGFFNFFKRDISEEEFQEQQKVKRGLEKTRTGFFQRIVNTLTNAQIDDDLYDQLEEQLILADVGPACAVRLVDELHDEVEEKHLKTGQEALDALRGMGLKLAIGSSSKNTKFILARLGLGDYFDAISDGTNITRSKPDPQVFLMAADFIDMKPADCLVVEDAKAGIQAAVSGGFDSAGLGEAAACGMATHAMKTFGDLKAICR